METRTEHKLPIVYKAGEALDIGTHHHIFDVYQEDIAERFQSTRPQKVLLEQNLRKLPEEYQTTIFSKGSLRSIDATICEEAERTGVPVDGLETYDELEEYTQLIRTLMQRYKKAQRTEGIDTLGFMNAYIEGNIGSLRRYQEQKRRIEEGLLDRDEVLMYRTLDDRRNRNMAAKAMPWLDKPSIIAVGTHHLICRGSILDKFLAEGYNVARTR